MEFQQVEISFLLWNLKVSGFWEGYLNSFWSRSSSPPVLHALVAVYGEKSRGVVHQLPTHSLSMLSCKIILKVLAWL